MSVSGLLYICLIRDELVGDGVSKVKGIYVGWVWREAALITLI